MRSNTLPCRSMLFFLIILLGADKGWSYNFQSLGIYRSYNDLSPWAYQLQSDHPDLVQVVQYGTSYLGRPLLALNITANPTTNNPDKPEFLFTGGLHAREVIGSEATVDIAQNLVNGYYSSDPAVRSSYQDMLSKRDVWIIPQQNPDGRMQVEAGLSYQRKNMHPYAGQGSTTTGVDLNRNFPHLWNWASNSVADETFRGSAPLSEPETSSLWNLLHDKSKFSHLLTSVDFHSGATAILTAWSSPTDYQNNENQIPLPVQAKYNSLAAALNQKTGLPTARLGYDSYGTESDSLYEAFGSYSMTEEIYMGSYIGGYPDNYFSFFNPIDTATRDAATKKAVDSALYLLSDAAFAVPEPASFILLATVGFALLIVLRHRRS